MIAIIPNSNGEDNRPSRSLLEFNKHHDKLGRFSSGPGAGTGMGDYPPIPGHEHDFDSQLRYSDGHGHYTPERAALHEAIIEHFLRGKTPVTNPLATMLGGGPASGKSTIIDARKLHKPNTVEINPDLIREYFPDFQRDVKAYKAGHGDERAAERTHAEASEISKELTKRASQRSLNILLDGTGDSSVISLAGKIQALRATGHRVEGVYVSLPTDTAFKFMRKRGETSGRFVPEEILRETHAAVSRTLPAAVRQGLFDKIAVYDTTVFKHPVLLMTGGRGQKTVRHDPKRWRVFLAKGKEHAASNN